MPLGTSSSIFHRKITSYRFKGKNGNAPSRSSTGFGYDLSKKPEWDRYWKTEWEAGDNEFWVQFDRGFSIGMSIHTIKLKLDVDRSLSDFLSIQSGNELISIVQNSLRESMTDSLIDPDKIRVKNVDIEGPAIGGGFGIGRRSLGASAEGQLAAARVTLETESLQLSAKIMLGVGMGGKWGRTWTKKGKPGIKEEYSSKVGPVEFTVASKTDPTLAQAAVSSTAMMSILPSFSKKPTIAAKAPAVSVSAKATDETIHATATSYPASATSTLEPSTTADATLKDENPTSSFDFTITSDSSWALPALKKYATKIINNMDMDESTRKALLGTFEVIGDFKDLTKVLDKLTDKTQPLKVIDALALSFTGIAGIFSLGLSVASFFIEKTDPQIAMFEAIQNGLQQIADLQIKCTEYIVETLGNKIDYWGQANLEEIIYSRALILEAIEQTSAQLAKQSSLYFLYSTHRLDSILHMQDRYFTLLETLAKRQLSKLTAIERDTRQARYLIEKEKNTAFASALTTIDLKKKIDISFVSEWVLEKLSADPHFDIGHVLTPDLAFQYFVNELGAFDAYLSSSWQRYFESRLWLLKYSDGCQTEVLNTVYEESIKTLQWLQSHKPHTILQSQFSVVKNHIQTMVEKLLIASNESDFPIGTSYTEAQNHLNKLLPSDAMDIPDFRDFLTAERAEYLQFSMPRDMHLAVFTKQITHKPSKIYSAFPQLFTNLYGSPTEGEWAPNYASSGRTLIDPQWDLNKILKEGCNQFEFTYHTRNGNWHSFYATEYQMSSFAFCNKYKNKDIRKSALFYTHTHPNIPTSCNLQSKDTPVYKSFEGRQLDCKIEINLKGLDGIKTSSGQLLWNSAEVQKAVKIYTETDSTPKTVIDYYKLLTNTAQYKDEVTEPHQNILTNTLSFILSEKPVARQFTQYPVGTLVAMPQSRPVYGYIEATMDHYLTALKFPVSWFSPSNTALMNFWRPYLIAESLGLGNIRAYLYGKTSVASTELNLQIQWHSMEMDKGTYQTKPGPTILSVSRKLNYNISTPVYRRAAPLFLWKGGYFAESDKPHSLITDFPNADRGRLILTKHKPAKSLFTKLPIELENPIARIQVTDMIKKMQRQFLKQKYSNFLRESILNQYLQLQPSFQALINILQVQHLLTPIEEFDLNLRLKHLFDEEAFNAYLDKNDDIEIILRDLRDAELYITRLVYTISKRQAFLPQIDMLSDINEKFETILRKKNAETVTSSAKPHEEVKYISTKPENPARELLLSLSSLRMELETQIKTQLLDRIELLAFSAYPDGYLTSHIEQLKKLLSGSQIIDFTAPNLIHPSVSKAPLLAVAYEPWLAKYIPIPLDLLNNLVGRHPELMTWIAADWLGFGECLYSITMKSEPDSIYYHFALKMEFLWPENTIDLVSELNWISSNKVVSLTEGKAYSDQLYAALNFKEAMQHGKLKLHATADDHSSLQQRCVRFSESTLATIKSSIKTFAPILNAMEAIAIIKANNTCLLPNINWDAKAFSLSDVASLIRKLDDYLYLAPTDFIANSTPRNFLGIPGINPRVYSSAHRAELPFYLLLPIYVLKALQSGFWNLGKQILNIFTPSDHIVESTQNLLIREYNGVKQSPCLFQWPTPLNYLLPQTNVLSTSNAIDIAPLRPCEPKENAFELTFGTDSYFRFILDKYKLHELQLAVGDRDGIALAQSMTNAGKSFVNSFSHSFTPTTLTCFGINSRIAKLIAESIDLGLLYFLYGTPSALMNIATLYLVEREILSRKTAHNINILLSTVMTILMFSGAEMSIFTVALQLIAASIGSSLGYKAGKSTAMMLFGRDLPSNVARETSHSIG